MISKWTKWQRRVDSDWYYNQHSLLFTMKWMWTKLFLKKSNFIGKKLNEGGQREGRWPSIVFVFYRPRHWRPNWYVRLSPRSQHLLPTGHTADPLDPLDPPGPPGPPLSLSLSLFLSLLLYSDWRRIAGRYFCDNYRAAVGIVFFWDSWAPHYLNLG